ncbi:MAG: HlyD family efflux transporter periplasmic adaptor subunit [Cyanobium sp. Prado107]|jgi:HlyD family secretion protein|nr:HlyD family efflux transporter periplasmic adaptor subunit [Cyanobium sp. Prado107]
MRQRLTLVIALAVAVGAGGALWLRQRSRERPPAFASGNGRLEAVAVDVATRSAGRLLRVEVQEGDAVQAGQVVARMDTASLQAQLLEARAELERARTQVATGRSLVEQRRAQQRAAEQVIEQRQAERDLAALRFQRASQLMREGALAREVFDTDRSRLAAAEAALSQARADAAAGSAAVQAAAGEVRAAQAAVEAAQARIQRLQSDIDETVLTAPVSGRVQIRIAEPGEVLAAGGRVLNLLDLSDLHMTFFLPTREAGRLRLGSEARLILDAAPDLVIPARITYVASGSQFTPRTVETRSEREKLMFRVKAQVDPQLVRRYASAAKSGLPGVAWVRLDPAVPWPRQLQVRLPPAP